MSIETFPCPRCRSLVAGCMCCYLAAAIVVPMKERFIVAGDIPHIHPMEAPMQLQSRVLVAASTTSTASSGPQIGYLF